MAKIIDFPYYLNNYKFLYNRGKHPVYEIWAETEMQLHKIYLYLPKKFKWSSAGMLSSTMKIKKDFMPVPDDGFKQKDGFYHGYIQGTIYEDEE